MINSYFKFIHIVMSVQLKKPSFKNEGFFIINENSNIFLETVHLKLGYLNQKKGGSTWTLKMQTVNLKLKLKMDEEEKLC